MLRSALDLSLRHFLTSTSDPIENISSKRLKTFFFHSIDFQFCASCVIREQCALWRCGFLPFRHRRQHFVLLCRDRDLHAHLRNSKMTAYLVLFMSNIYASGRRVGRSLFTRPIFLALPQVLMTYYYAPKPSCHEHKCSPGVRMCLNCVEINPGIFFQSIWARRLNNVLPVLC